MCFKQTSSALLVLRSFSRVRVKAASLLMASFLLLETLVGNLRLLLEWE